MTPQTEARPRLEADLKTVWRGLTGIDAHEAFNRVSAALLPGTPAIVEVESDILGMFVSKTAVVATLNRLAKEHADMALEGDPDHARLREAMEAAFTRAKYAVAFLPALRPVASPAVTVEQVKGWLNEAAGWGIAFGMDTGPNPDAKLTMLADAILTLISEGR